MFERFTDRARRVVILAQDEARMLNHDTLGTEHLLLGIASEGECLPARGLLRHGSLEELRERVAALRPRGEHPVSGHIPFTPRFKKVLDLSLREALQMGHNYIAAEHLLLGVLREGEGHAVTVLAGIGAETGLEVVRGRVLRAIGDGAPLDFEASLPEGPEDGHTFRLIVESRGSYGVTGQPGHTDADHFGPPWTLEVRAWSLPAALRKAAELPLTAWDMGEDD